MNLPNLEFRELLKIEPGNSSRNSAFNFYRAALPNSINSYFKVTFKNQIIFISFQ